MPDIVQHQHRTSYTYEKFVAVSQSPRLKTNNNKFNANYSSVYNLKRSIASLPPLSLQTFNDNVLAADERAQRDCSACQMVFEDLKTYQSHLKSRHHLQKLNNTEKEKVFNRKAPDTESPLDHLAAISSQIENLELSDYASDASEENLEIFQDEIDDVPVFEESSCLFCREVSPDLEQNIAHMHCHGFTIPDREHIIDVTSFLSYLHVLITRFNECILCGAIRSSIEGIRAHMIDKSHCKVNNAQGTEFADFYEFPDSTEGVNSRGKRTQSETRLLHGAAELNLPSGKTLGHRSRAHLYRQHLPSNPADGQRKTLTDSTESQSPFLAHRDMRVTSRSKMGLVGLSDLERKSLRAVEKKMMRVEMRARNEYRAVLEKGGNKQKYFKVSYSLGYCNYLILTLLSAGCSWSSKWLRMTLTF